MWLGWSRDQTFSHGSVLRCGWRSQWSGLWVGVHVVFGCSFHTPATLMSVVPDWGCGGDVGSGCFKNGRCQHLVLSSLRRCQRTNIFGWESLADQKQPKVQRRHTLFEKKGSILSPWEPLGLLWFTYIDPSRSFIGSSGEGTVPWRTGWWHLLLSVLIQLLAVCVFFPMKKMNKRGGTS